MTDRDDAAGRGAFQALRGVGVVAALSMAVSALAFLIALVVSWIY